MCVEVIVCYINVVFLRHMVLAIMSTFCKLLLSHLALCDLRLEKHLLTYLLTYLLNNRQIY